MAVAGAEIFWDAGRLLADRASSSRVVYTAVRRDGDLGSPLGRTDFTAANVDVLAGFLEDVQNENAALIEFIRGTGRNWKLGDINRSTPVIVGPPARDAGYMGEGYAEFKETHRDRAKVIYVGANDGMLHCFDALTGEELWGYIPYNLLPKLKEMYPVDPANNARFFLPSQTGYVDATPAVADVRYSGAWHTVLICGQGPGTGAAIAGGLNYYWALDVTVPDNPQPLWEITHRDGTTGELTMGETRSTPAIGRINDGGVARWVAFTGSGYDNDGSSTVTCGTYLYVIDVETGTFLAAWPAETDVDTSALAEADRYTNISPAIVASPAAVDNTNDGYIDLVYTADLDGRIYRLDTSDTNIAEWTFTSIYEDHLNYPIVTKPAVWLNPYEATPTPPRIYFGTGGHDRNLGDYNPNTDELSTRTFSFVGLIDNGTDTATIEWYMGDPALLGGLATTRDTGDLGAGFKVWADPVVADMILYFSTLSGSIESANPCANLAGGGGHLYARYIRQSSAIPVGGTAFRATEGTPPEYLQLISKARQAVTVGEAGYDETARVNRREIYVQQYDSTIQQLVQPIGSLLRIRSWREVYRVIWD
jgi:outer membrane protein assembly factor BamB